MGLLKRKCDIKRAGKRISQNIVRQRKSTFFDKEVLRETCEKSNAGSKGKEWLIMQINANNLYQRKLYETSLYGHVRSDKQDGDKGLGMRSGRSP
jgi:hypothetical protein